jgi:hypothetical protein
VGYPMLHFDGLAGNTFPLASTTQPVISLQACCMLSSRYLNVFVRLVTSYGQVWDKLLSSCNKVDKVPSMVTRRANTSRYPLDKRAARLPAV